MSALKVSWTSTQYHAERTALLEHLASKADADGTFNPVQYLLGPEYVEAATDPSARLLRELVGIITVLNLQTKTAPLHDRDIRRLFETGERILRLAGIDYSRSALSFIYRELYLAAAATRSSGGQGLAAAWLTETAEHLCYRPDDQQRLVMLEARAEALLRLGHAEAARDLLLQVATLHDHARIRESLARAEWLSGRHPAAFQQITAHMQLSGASWHWLHALLSNQRQDNHLIYYNSVRRHAYTPANIAFASLWMYAQQNTSLRNHVLKVSSLKKRFAQLQIHQDQAAFLVEALLAVETAYDNTIQLLPRLNQLGEIFANRNRFVRPEHELVFLVAAVRHAIRYSQYSLADMICAEYKSLCARISPASQDVLEIAADLVTRQTLTLQPAAPPPRTGSGTLSRSARIAGLVGRGAALWTTAKLSGLVSGEAARRRIHDRNMQQLGEYALTVIADLKGGFMKLGQILASSTEVPDDLSSPLKSLHHQADRTDPAASRRIVEEDLRAPLDRIFAEWIDDPFAVGSIGQVFRARTHAGHDVAVKVQHPQIRKTLESDLRMISWVKPVIRHFLPLADVDGMIREVRDQVLLETDYRREAGYQSRFAQIFAGDSLIHVPAVHPELSGDRVVTSDFVKGMTFHDFVEEAGQDARNLAALTIMRMFGASLYRHQLFNADPHPGNYLFHPDGRISFLDFGCVREYPASFVQTLLATQRSIILGDPVANRQAFIDMGYIPDPDNFDFDGLYRLFRDIYTPVIQDKVNRLDQKWFAGFSSLQLQTEIGRTLTPPPESAMMVRISWGLVAILAQLEPALNFHQLITEGLRSLDHLGNTPVPGNIVA